MKVKSNDTGLILSALGALFLAVARGPAQLDTVGHANDFTSVEYYGATNQLQIKSRLSGAEASPQPGGLLVIKGLKLETFDVKGKPEIVVTAPECVYDTQNGVASSPGRLQLQTGDGKYRIEGEGFLWRRNDSFLIISNRVQTVIETVSEKKTVL
jgi:hypothetical protein